VARTFASPINAAKRTLRGRPFRRAYPEQNSNCDATLNLYRTHLADGAVAISGFDTVTLESCLAVLRTIGDAETADTLYNRYLNFYRVEQAIFG
jgi:hypothetical protein